MADDIQNLELVSPPTPPEKKLPQDRLSTLRTYQGDVASVVRGENVSMASIALKERARALERGEEEAAPTPQKNIVLLVLSSLLILIGLGTISYFAFFRKTAPEPVVDTQVQSLIFADKNTIIDTAGSTGAAITTQLRRALGDARSLGTIENIILSKKIPATNPTADPVAIGLTAQEYLHLLAPKAPDTVIRLLDGAYMYGIHGYGKNFGFLLFQTSDPEKVYSEMLSWEKQSLARDLTPLLREDTDPATLEAGTFQDALLKNIDTRVLRDQSNDIVLVYAFLTRNQLLIAGSEETFNEVLRRFTTPRPVVR